MNRKVRVRGWVAAVAVLTVWGSSGCSETVRTGRASSYLVIDDLVAVAGGGDDEETHVLASDVLTSRGVFEDHGVVTLRLAMKDVGVGPTPNNSITVNRYRVSFRRTDGRNQPGVDVPWPHEAAGTVTVAGISSAELEFNLVRLQAKLEPPLAQLIDNQGGPGGALAISTIADVTFYGHDQVGNEVTVTGSIAVNFADWADVSTGGGS